MNSNSGRKDLCLPTAASCKHGRRDLNSQPADLESAALPIELRPYPPGYQPGVTSYVTLYVSCASDFSDSTSSTPDDQYLESLFGPDSCVDRSLCTPSKHILSSELTFTAKKRKPAPQQLCGTGEFVHNKPQAALRESQNYSTIFVTTPEPTVRPPSRIAKRLPSSRAIGLCSSTSTFTLSPGIHISAPPRSVVEPVTSVVRK